MYFLIFLVTRFSGLRIGASVTHSGGNINRTCLDFFRKCHHPSLSLLCCANCARNHLPLITKTRIDTRICHTCSFVFGAYCENGTRSTRDVTFNTQPDNNGSPPGGCPLSGCLEQGAPQGTAGLAESRLKPQTRSKEMEVFPLSQNDET